MATTARRVSARQMTGWGPLLTAWSATQILARRLRARAAAMNEDIESLSGWVLEAQEARGPFDQHVLEGWQLVQDLEAQRTKLLAEAHALEDGLGLEVRRWTH